ncbi:MULTISPECIES: fumarylacetoacetate hydrolase family protein [unclassified Caballeronia]|jgi:acylpyruvate hydrolase|uniref:fumarylacetoacetate hydrolase family protein n=1 Tax=unclassified Caballeronia TaxID=2646786 RepID=UPI003ECC705D
MRIVSFLQDGQHRIGLRNGNQVRVITDPAIRSPLELIRDGTGALGQIYPLDALHLLPPIPQPGKVICLGLNYADHAKEGGNPIPDYPAVFLRATSSLVGHGQPILRPANSDKLDYEAELAIVIGRKAKNVSEGDALTCIAGYACFNDGTIRDYQRKSTQWTVGKNFDATGGFGPDLVTADELPIGAHGLRVLTRLNGKTMQDGNTADMIFSIPRTIALLSDAMTLEPGDVIITGTPAGVGYARKPPVFMQPGDICEIEIEGVGTLSNPISAA